MKVLRICGILFALALMIIGVLELVSRPPATSTGWLMVAPISSGMQYAEWGIPYRGGMFMLNAADQSVSVQHLFPSADIQPVSWSPDGQRIAYQVMDNLASIIFTARPDGSNPRQLTPDASFSTLPSWSPDGRWIAFIAIRQEHANLYRIRPDGSGEQLVVTDIHTNALPSWSPDGRWIAVVLNSDGNWDIYRVRPDGSHLERLTTNPDADSLPHWSPDGRWIVYLAQTERTWHLYRVSPGGDNPTEMVALQSLSQRPPSWSPDSQWLAYETQNGDIFRVRYDGTASQQLTASAARDAFPSWSPDGKWITFLSTEVNSMSFLYKMRPDGSQFQKIYDYPVSSRPLWSPHIKQSSYAGWKVVGGAILIVCGIVWQRRRGSIPTTPPQTVSPASNTRN